MKKKKSPFLLLCVIFVCLGFFSLLCSFVAYLVQDKDASSACTVSAVLDWAISLVFAILFLKKNNKKFTVYASAHQKTSAPALMYYKKVKEMASAEKVQKNPKTRSNGLANNIINTFPDRLKSAKDMEEFDKYLNGYVGAVSSGNNLDESIEMQLSNAIKFIFPRKQFTLAELKKGLEVDEDQCQKIFNLFTNLKIIERKSFDNNQVIWQINDKEWTILLPADMPTSNIDVELARVDAMTENGILFENYVAKLLQLNGFATKQTPATNDYGVDVLALDKNRIQYAIQCKCYHSKLGNSCVQEVIAGKQMYNCQVGVVITNNYFTKNAEELANSNGILLWDRDKLVELIKNTF